MNFQHFPHETVGSHGRRASALVQVLLVCLVLFVGAVAAAWVLRSGSGAAPGEAPEEKGRGKNPPGEEQATKEEPAAKNRVELTPEKLKHARLTLEEARPATIRLGLRVFGQVVPNEEKLAHVSPRYAGIVRQVNRRLGDTVAAGETLARIESNESLQTYDLKAPLAGTIIARDAATGEFVATDKNLFTVADLNIVWVDFQVYQQDFGRLRVGQPVRVSLPNRSTASQPAGSLRAAEPPDSDHPADPAPDDLSPAPPDPPPGAARGTLAYLSPFGAATTQTTLARTYVSNQDGAWRPGLFVTGEIAVEEIAAAITVREDAVQTLDGREVVFVESNGGFEARPVQIGRRDAERAQVLAGLRAGDRYVAANAFLLKAELGKAEAGED